MPNPGKVIQYYWNFLVLSNHKCSTQHFSIKWIISYDSHHFSIHASVPCPGITDMSFICR